ncbi:MAG: hypothetical protein M1826_006320 [Phylliscum demangeonii]|nr:MAG: hypothetical protein M1826_006320 [Phylliscum demangeonii]
MSADIADKKKAWLSHVVERRVQNQVMLAKRTTDEESARSQEDVKQEAVKQEAVKRGTNASVGPIHYTPEEMAAFKAQYNSARRESNRLRDKVKDAKDASQDDVAELLRLTALTHQRKLVVTRARQGKPIDRRTSLARQDVASLAQDPEIEELAKLGVYSARQLAEYKRSSLDATVRFQTRKKELAKIAKVRKITKAEEKDLANLQRDYNLQRKVWDRARLGKPVDYRVDPPKHSVDDLLESAKLHEIAQSSGYSVKELAEAKRRLLDSKNAVADFERKLAEVKKGRQVTPEETTQLQALSEEVKRQKRMFHRMSHGRPANDGDYLPRKDVSSLLKDAEIQRIAQRGGYSVEEVAVQKRGFLDALYEYRVARELVLSVKDEGGILTSEQEDGFLEIDKAYQLQKTGWDRMRAGEPVDPAIPPPPKVGRLGQLVAALRQNDPARRALSVDGLSKDKRPSPYTADQIAAYNQDQLDALSTLRAFLKKMAAAGHPPTTDDHAQHQALRNDYNEKKRIWDRARRGKPLDRLVRKQRGAAAAPKSEESQESRPGSQEQVSQASPAKEDPSTRHPPLHMSGPRHLLAPVLSSARHLLQGVGRQWRAMPWTRSLAQPRLNMAKPAELLRAEHALL